MSTEHHLYQGNLISSLVGLVEKAHAHNSTICRTCDRELGDHSHIGHHCPSPDGKWLTTSFSDPVHRYILQDDEGATFGRPIQMNDREAVQRNRSMADCCDYRWCVMPERTW